MQSGELGVAERRGQAACKNGLEDHGSEAGRLEVCACISEKELCLQDCDSFFPLLPSSENNYSPH